MNIIYLQKAFLLLLEDLESEKKITGNSFQLIYN